MTNLKKRKDRNLAEGEVTRHAHRCSAGTVYDIAEEEGNARLLVAPKGCKITHEEHNTQVVTPGRYITFKATEQDHAAAEAREVVD